MFDTPLKITLSAAIAALVLWGLLLVAMPGGVAAIDEQVGDFVWRSAARSEPERRIVLVDIDEGSLRQLGPWPWSRGQLAKLSDKLAEAGAALQIFDIVFPEKAEGDALFIHALGRNNAVLAQVFALQENTRARSGTPGYPFGWVACPSPFPVAQDYIANNKEFSAHLPVGHITPVVAADGSVRHQPAVICHNQRSYGALFLVAGMRSGALESVGIEPGAGLWAPDWQLTGLPFYKGGVPLDSQGNVRIPWQLRPEAFVALAAADVLAGRVPAGLLENAWVVIGSTALGLNDRVATPFSGVDAGLLVHAQLLRGLLDGDITSTPRHARLIAAIIVLLLALPIAALAWYRRKPVYSAISLAVGLTLIWLLGKAFLLVQVGIWLPWAAPAIYLAAFAIFLTLFEHARSRLERDRVFAHLASYLPGPVAAALAVRDPSDAIEAERKTITVLFADIRNFSAYSELRPPEESTAVLHAFFSLATNIVERYGGMVESFQGDAVLAVWGAGGRRNGSGAAGAEADLALLAAVELWNQSRNILPEPKDGAFQPMELGIGMEMGVATVGSFGLARRRTHLAMGRTVTTAARLEQMTVELAHPILIGEGMAACLNQHCLESQGVFLLEGLMAPCHIYAYPLKHCLRS